jgi:hypothetical protein
MLAHTRACTHAPQPTRLFIDLRVVGAGQSCIAPQRIYVHKVRTADPRRRSWPLAPKPCNSLCVYLCARACASVCVRARVCVCVFVRARLCVCARACVYVRGCVHVCERVRVCMCVHD